MRAGIIGEIGCQAPWTDLEKRVMRGAVVAQQQTGAAINVHPGRDPDQPQEVADFVSAQGADRSRVVISHIDRTIFDDERLFRLADSGCVIELDLFGQDSPITRSISTSTCPTTPNGCAGSAVSSIVDILIRS